MCVSLWVITCEVTKQLSYGWSGGWREEEMMGSVYLRTDLYILDDGLSPA
jgi:hypothetical protein